MDSWRKSYNGDWRPHNHLGGLQGLCTLVLLLRSSFSSSFSCSSFTSFSTSHASSSSSSVWGVWSHSQKCLKLPSSSGAGFSTSLHLGLSLPRLLRRWGGSFGGGGRGGTWEAAFAGLGISGAGQRLMVPPPSSSLWDWLSSSFCWDEPMDLGCRKKHSIELVFHNIDNKMTLDDVFLKEECGQWMTPVIRTLGGSGGGTFGLIIVLDLLKNENNGGFDNILNHNNNTVYKRI